MNEMEQKVLKTLSHQYKTQAAASTEIINLQSILNLPKGTEHFLTDIHGEYEQFNHVLKNGSGSVRRKIDEEFGNTISNKDKKSLATLIYYPESKLEIVEREEDNLEDWYKISLHRLVQVIKRVSSKYTRSKVRKALPKDFAYVIEELITEKEEIQDKEAYYNEIIHTIIRIGRAPQFIIALSHLIQRLVIDHLHIVGDIYDRGPGPHIIMDTLCEYHSVDVQWGNHDMVWMGAAAGSLACIANVIRMSARYGNLATLEDGYGINLLPLATFAMDTYKDDPCEQFGMRSFAKDSGFDEKTLRLIALMHKAISIMQFKEEARIIDRHPEFNMENRKLLHRMNLAEGTIDVDGHTYTLLDTQFPTVSADAPYALTEEEEVVMDKITHSFLTSDKLSRHIDCLLTHGCMYSIANSNLMYHASVPLNEDGSLKDVMIHGIPYHGIELMKKVGHIVREAFTADTDEAERLFAQDYIWYLWCGADSPLFDKNKMTTFERYFIADKEAQAEKKGFYYKYQNDEKTVDMILDSFGVKGEHRHIINGHVPVKASRGESPVKANGKLLVIDGGFSKAYQPETGIAGYTLTFHSRGLDLVQHQPFRSASEAVVSGDDIKSSTQIVEMSRKRMLVKDTDKGIELTEKVTELKKLLFAYRNGFIKERAK